MFFVLVGEYDASDFNNIYLVTLFVVITLINFFFIITLFIALSVLSF